MKGASRIPEGIYLIGGGRGRAAPRDLSVARIHEGVFQMMCSILMGPRKRINH